MDVVATDKDISNSSASPGKPRGSDRYQYLTQTNRGTPAGELLRSYWQPVALVSALGQDSPPQPIRIMGEDLVLFRDDQGKVGLVDRRCAHRRTDLVLGRIEDGGIRCPYHGWLFDVNGRCLDQPAEASSSAKDRIQIKSYPLHEAAGAFWAYLGKGEPPLFPLFPALAGDARHCYTTRWFGSCNWLQACEGNIDPIHTSYLHKMDLSDPLMKARWGVFASPARPVLSVEETRFGVRLYTVRQGASGDPSLRITNFVMPNSAAFGGYEGYLGEGGLTMLWDVPVDDEHHYRWEFIFHRSGELDKDSLERQYNSEKAEGDKMWRKKDEFFSQDREAMKGESYLGLGECFSVHDVAITEAQGTIHQQSEEHLASSDVAIARARRLLDEGAKQVMAGQQPRGVIREVEANEFSDLVVATTTLPPGTSKEEVCASYAKRTSLFTPLDTTR